jgi:serine/threonine-protein kinase
VTRLCPYCEGSTSDELCRIHQVPTVDLDIFDRPPAPIREGHVLAGRYRIERPLAEGGFGQVYVARQIAMSRNVALKVLRRAVRLGENALHRFYREVLTVSRLSHPNIVQVFDFGVDEETRAPFIVFELVDGRTLTEILEGHGALSERRTVRILLQVTRALVEAHAQGVVHRDLKPNNVMVMKLRDGSRHAKVLDFGLAKITDGEDALTGITAPGKAVGSPHFMSPEQCAGARVDDRSDLYSLGCLLHVMLAGRPPFDGKAAADLFGAHLGTPAPPLPDDIAGGAPSAAIRALHRSLLAKSPLGRPVSAAVVGAILEALDDGEEVDVQAALEQARKQAFAGAIPHVDSLATDNDLTAVAGGASAASSAGHEETTLPPVASARDEAAREMMEGIETIAPQKPEPLAPLAIPASVSAPVAVPRPASLAASREVRAASLGRSRRLAPIAASVAGVFAVGALGFVLGQRDRTPAPPPPVAAIAPAVEPPVVAPVAAPLSVKLKVTSEPPGAEVWEGDRLLGQTPIDLDGTARTLRFRARGYRDLDATLSEPGPFHAVLTPVRRARVDPPPPPVEPAPAKRKYRVW